MSKTPRKKFSVVNVLVAVLLGPIALFMLYAWVALGWIAYRPVPPAPRFRPEYSVVDSGAVGLPHYRSTYANPLDNYDARLTRLGAVVHLEETARDKDKAARKAVFLRVQKQLTLKNNYPPTITAVNGTHALLQNDGSLWDEGTQLWHDGNRIISVPRKIHSYSWQIERYGFYGLNAHDAAIGNAQIATGYATSGGTSSPHGRDFPLLWRGDARLPEDLNSLIARSDGWYLDRAIDINDHGQILCVGRKADDRGAEQYDPDAEHYVVLSPLTH